MNVTISMDPVTLAWVRIEAARTGRSVSAWVGGRLEAERLADDERRHAAARIDTFLDNFSGLALSDGGRITLDRDDLHHDRFRRFDDPALHPGQERPGQAGGLRSVAETPASFGGDET